MINNSSLQNLLATATDWSVVCEIYAAGTTPTSSGFDPNAALGRFAAVSGLTFYGASYKELVKSFGSIKRTVTKEINSTSVTFSNVTREMAAFEFANGFEGLIMVIRLFSRSGSTTLDLSQILFTGRCEKPDSGDKMSLTVKAKFILGGLDPVIPRRKFTTTDQEGRVSTDPEFEGFEFTPRYGTTSFPRVVHHGGFLGWWNRKIVQATISWSNYSDLDQGACVPEAFGRVQMQSRLIGGVDVGTALQTVNAFCEGEIYDFTSVRSVDPSFPLSATNYSEHLGKVGVLNGNNLSYVAPGYYSRTALVRVDVTNSAVDVNDAPPDIVGIVFGRLVTTPDGAGVWNTTAWSDNAAAITRFLLTDSHYFNLDANWIDDTYATECYRYNAEQIFDRSLSDFLFVEAG